LKRKIKKIIDNKLIIKSAKNMDIDSKGITEAVKYNNIFLSKTLSIIL